MSFLELTGVHKHFGEHRSRSRTSTSPPRGRVRVLPRAVGLRQDDDAADDRGLRDSPPPGTITHRRPGHHPQAAEPAQRGHGLPVLRALPEHDRRRQRRLRAEGPEAAAATRSRSASASCSSSSTCPTGAAATRTSCPAASSSASPSPGRSPSSRRSCSSTSRCPRSTPRSASRSATRSGTIQRQLGITTVYVTHDQEEALSLSDRVVVMSEGRMEQVGTPFEIYNFPSTAFVASFVGTLNVLDGTIVDAGRGELTISGQTVNVTRQFEGRPGQEVRLALRPGDGLARRPARSAASRLHGPGRRRQLPRLDRAHPGPDRSRTGLRQQRRSADGQVVILDEFNEPTLKLPQLGEHRRGELPDGRPARPGRDGARRVRRGAHRRGVTGRLAGARPPLAGIELLIFDKDGTLIEFHLMWGAWVDHLARGLEGTSGLALRDGLYELLGVDRESGQVHAHGLLAATPMSRIREAVVAHVAAAGAEPGGGGRGGRRVLACPRSGRARAAGDGPARRSSAACGRGSRASRSRRATTVTRRSARCTRSASTASSRRSPARTMASRTSPRRIPSSGCARSSGVPPARTAVVGDSPADLRMARSAGAGRAIGVLTGVGDRPTLEPLADLVLGSIAELAPG